MSYKQLEDLFNRAMMPCATPDDDASFLNAADLFLSGTACKYFKDKAQRLITLWTEDMVMMATIYA